MIPAKWPDVEAWFLSWVTPAKIVAEDAALTSVSVKNFKPSATGAYKQVLAVADYGQLITPITRYVRVRLQAWVVRADGKTADLKKAFNLANVAAYIAEQAPRDGNPIVSVQVDAGPSRISDSESGTEYQAVTLLLEIKKL